MKLKIVLLSCIYLFSPLSYAEKSEPKNEVDVVVDAPSGLRPCCAFGINMKSKLSIIPVPFFRVNNIVEVSDLASHHYNDGTQGVMASLAGNAEELNGLIYTSRGGIIDTAHVRDTGDNTFYLYNQIRGNLGIEMQRVLEAELRERVINLYPIPFDFNAQEQLKAEINLSGILAFRLAQWHEAAQWFGFTSVAGFKEYPSAYSPEDLYSNMLGAIIAMEIIEANPDLTLADYQIQYPIAFLKHLKELGAQDGARTKEVMDGLDGHWWDSKKRLPDKWVVKTRDYQPRLTITPHWGDSDERETLSLEPYAYLEKWGDATFVATNHERHFKALPAQLTNKSTWTVADLSDIAAFAKAADDKEKLSNNHLIKGQ
ncbi:membrane protein [Psychromonas marina]|uniref:Membrane protein n=1 Tax=Psychromonas marina TaxID=88364 RepID=A0ABQ6E2X7_9GAMM|nr:DUF4056 domain-containing protein [Psychromonas marina]GLS91543.1 membrane protein [Psychromonas marina]